MIAPPFAPNEAELAAAHTAFMTDVYGAVRDAPADSLTLSRALGSALRSTADRDAWRAVVALTARLIATHAFTDDACSLRLRAFVAENADLLDTVHRAESSAFAAGDRSAPRGTALP